MTISPQITYVQDPAAMHTAMEALQGEHSLAFDLEFDRDRYTYGFSLCLIQVATPKHCFIFDPLADIDLQPLYQVFENPIVEKLVHCPSEDLRLLHSLGCYPKNVVDTEVYCKLLNYEQTSLSAMLQEHLGLAIDKKMQKSNWHQRPLTAAHIEYAASDVIHLHDLRHALHQKIVPKKMELWVQQEFALLDTTIHVLDAKTDFIKPKDRQFLSESQIFILNTMMAWRDAMARKLNKPAHQVMPEAVLRDICLGRLSAADLRTTIGIHPQVKSGDGLASFKKTLAATQQEAIDKKLASRRNGRYADPETQARIDAEKVQREEWKTTLFTPIQQALAKVYGENTVRFIISSGFVNSVLRSENTLTDLKPEYKRQLVRAAATHLQLDISRFW